MQIELNDLFTYKSPVFAGLFFSYLCQEKMKRELNFKGAYISQFAKLFI